MLLNKTKKGFSKMNSNVKKSIYMILLGIGFGIIPLFIYGMQGFVEYQTAYTLEKLLSVDNLAVMASIFAAFKCSDAMQHKALNYGIIGAVVMRIIFMMLGAEVLERFSAMNYVFGALLVYSAYKMLHGEEASDEEPSMVAKVRRWFPRMSTLAMVIVAVELTDVLFAVDSVPAVLSVTDNRFIAISSNIAAIMGLRALFFVLKDGMDKIKYLNQTLAVVLSFVGCKMALHNVVHIGTLANVGIIGSIFGVGIWASLKK
jgi:tellurite resistance protein TerC